MADCHHYFQTLIILYANMLINLILILQCDLGAVKFATRIQVISDYSVKFPMEHT